MHSLYFVLPYLDPLTPDCVPSMNLPALRDFLQENLPAFYHKLLAHILLFVDLTNIPSVLNGAPVAAYGNFSLAQLHEAFSLHDFLPEYVFAALHLDQDGKGKLEKFGQAFWEYFKTAEQYASGFVSEYITFLKRLWVALLAYRCAKGGLALQEELCFVWDRDPDIYFFMQQKGKSFTAPSEFSELFQKLESVQGKAHEEDDVIHKFHFFWLESWRDTFSVNSILAYLAQFVLLVQRDGRLFTQNRVELINELGSVRW